MQPPCHTRGAHDRGTVAVMNACVFCGRPIGADEPSSGRPPMAAHAACADAALADDHHWDAVARATPEPELDDEPAEEPDGGSRATVREGGCLALVLACLPTVVLVLMLAAAVVVP
jgi:hypothetical protein